MLQSGEILGRLLGTLLEITLPVIKNIIKTLATSVLISLGLTVAAWAVDAEIHEKTLEYAHPLDSDLHTTTLIISNDEREDMMKIVTSLEDSGLLIKGVSKAVQNETKEQKGGLFNVIRYIRC